MRRTAVFLFALIGLASPALAQQSLGAANACVSIGTDKMGTGSIQVSGTWAGTITWYVYNAGGPRLPVDLATPDAPGTPINSTTANGGWSGSVASWQVLEACMTSYTSGTASVRMNTSPTGGGGGSSAEITLGDVMIDLTSTNALLTTGNGQTDGIEASVDGLEALIGTTNTTLTTQNGYVDGLEALIGTTNTSLTTIDGRVDGLEGFVDGLETLLGTSNTNTTTIAGDTTDIEAAVELIDDVLAPVAPGAATATKSALIAGQYNVAGVTLTDGQQAAAQFTSTGALLVSGGGTGTEYTTNAAAPTNPTGGTIVCERTDTLGTLSTESDGEWSNCRLSSRGAVYTAIDGTVTVTGTITANAGTNASTALLALETGGNLAAAAASLNTLDNAISGAGFNITQLGGSATGFVGAGAVGAATQRVTLGSDDPAVASLGTLDNAVSGAGFNITQMNGVNVTMGAGATGTGVQRVIEANDSQLSAGVGASGDTAATAGSTGSLTAKARLMTTQLDGIATSAALLDNAVSGNGFQLTSATVVATVFDLTNSNPLAVQVVDSAGTAVTPSTLFTHDTTLGTITSVTGDGTFCRAESSTPTSVTAGDAVLAWCDLTGRLHTSAEIAQGSTTSGQVGYLMSGAVTTSAPTYTSGQSSPFSLDTTGSVRVSVTSGSTGNGAASNTGSAVPTQGDYQAVNIGGTLRGQTGVNYTGTSYAGDVNIAAFAGASAAAGAGAVTAGTQRVTLGSDDPGVASLATIAGMFGTAGTADSQVVTVQGVASMTPILATVTASNLDIQSGGADLATETTAAAILTSTNFAAAFGTAGTADTQVMSVQGIASMTPLLVNPGTAANFGVYVEDGGETAGGNLMMAGAVVRTSATGSSATNNDNATFNVDALGRLWIRRGDPCADHARLQTAAISTAASGNVEIVALNGSDLIYICGYDAISTTAQGVQWIYGTGTACATGETDISGVMDVGATGGMVRANAGAPQMIVPAGNAFCVEKSTTVQLSGYVTYVRTAAP